MGENKTFKTVVVDLKHPSSFDKIINDYIHKDWYIYHISATGDKLVAVMYKFDEPYNIN